MRGANEAKAERARRLRLDSTRAELLLWNKIRARTLVGRKFVRQQPIGRYVVDFVCRGRRLIIEADGGQPATSRSDKIRDEWLRQRGYRVLRFWNNEVIANTDGVLETIADVLREGTPLTRIADAIRPLPASGGEVVRTLDQAYRGN